MVHARATFEGILAHIIYLFRKTDFNQARTVEKRLVTEHAQQAGKLGTTQFAASRESAPPNGLNVRQIGHRSKRTAVHERLRAYLYDASPSVDRAQSKTPLESASRDNCKFRRQRNLFQFLAVLERRRPQPLKASRQDNRPQVQTCRKGIGADFPHALGNDNFDHVIIPPACLGIDAYRALGKSKARSSIAYVSLYRDLKRQTRAPLTNACHSSNPHPPRRADQA